MKKECSCEQCVACCSHQPGWFLPGEAEKAAEFLKMDFEEFKNKYLIQEYWEGGADVLAPRKTYQVGPFRRAHYDEAWKTGRCIFLEEGKCKIHPFKPHECKVTFGCQKVDGRPREKIQRAWGSITI